MASVQSKKKSTIFKSRFYQILVSVFTLFLLFGADIRNLFPNRLKLDNIFDWISVATFAFFLLDILLRMYVTPNYFKFQCCTFKRSSSSSMPVVATGAGARAGGVASRSNPAFTLASDILRCISSFQVGSFFFWFDLISTVAILFGPIHYIKLNDKYDQTKETLIRLDEYGFPTEGFPEENMHLIIFGFRDFVNTSEFKLIIQTLKTLRVSRLVHSQRVAQMVSKVNWYWVGTLNGVFNKKKGNQETIRRKNSSELINILALGLSVHVRANKQNRRGSSKLHTRLFAMFRNDDFPRQVAATRIQRTWRAAKKRDEEDEDSRFGDTAGKSKERSAQQQFDNDASAEGTIPVDGENPRAKKESQVGEAMREKTGQNVAFMILIAFMFTITLTYSELDTTKESTMVVLHEQTSLTDFTFDSLQAAFITSIPDLLTYESGGNISDFDYKDVLLDLRDREIRTVTVIGGAFRENQVSKGTFNYRQQMFQQSWVDMLSTIFILMIWMFGIRAFLGPVMMLVVIPIERMVQLLGMMTDDPLGYQSTSKHKRFMAEENRLTKNTFWTQEMLRGMETHFLMATISRIGSLMKVGFGSAGVEIIRQNLAKKTGGKDQSILMNQGRSVSCVFLFCDIRQFTDCTESLQEEVFKFTNRIAAVVHSYCHAYGGAANKNIGDAFLCSWLLDDKSRNSVAPSWGNNPNRFSANSHQADKALLAVVKICMALQHDDFYLDVISPAAKDRLLAKLAGRKGARVQMGCGLHAGKAVQGAIGSEKKIDATYIGESVDRSEFLESSTKKYGVPILLSDDFYSLLDNNNRRRCRMVDQLILIENDEEDLLDKSDILETGEVLKLYTFDMHIEALWKNPKTHEDFGEGSGSDAFVVDGDISQLGGKKGSRKSGVLRDQAKTIRRSMNRLNSNTKQSTDGFHRDDSSHMVDSEKAKKGGLKGFRRQNTFNTSDEAINIGEDSKNLGISGKVKGWTPPQLLLPTGPQLYMSTLWQTGDIKCIRNKYLKDFPFFQQFQSGLQAFYCKDWRKAKKYFTTILEHAEYKNDGPSKYFMKQINENNGRPPRNFIGYGRP